MYIYNISHYHPSMHIQYILIHHLILTFYHNCKTHYHNITLFIHYMLWLKKYHPYLCFALHTIFSISYFNTMCHNFDTNITMSYIFCSEKFSKVFSFFPLPLILYFHWPYYTSVPSKSACPADFHCNV